MVILELEDAPLMILQNIQVARFLSHISRHVLGVELKTRTLLP
jgi:hypothetical protein